MPRVWQRCISSFGAAYYVHLLRSPFYNKAERNDFFQYDAREANKWRDILDDHNIDSIIYCRENLRPYNC